MQKRKLLELFAGACSYGKVAAKMNYEVLSVDKFVEVDLTCGIEDLTKEMILEHLGTPDVIVASPTCSVWSKTGWFNHWDSKVYKRSGCFKGKTPYANESVEMVRKTIEIFSWFPEATFFMENPEGLLWLHPVIGSFVNYNLADHLRREKVTYCQYGFGYMKPTHIWTNSKTWIPRPHCKNGDPCHTSSPRGGKISGVMGQKDSFIRSVIPKELCTEILLSTVPVDPYGPVPESGDRSSSTLFEHVAQ